MKRIPAFWGLALLLAVSFGGAGCSSKSAAPPYSLKPVRLSSSQTAKPAPLDTASLSAPDSQKEAALLVQDPDSGPSEKPQKPAADKSLDAVHPAPDTKAALPKGDPSFTDEDPRFIDDEPEPSPGTAGKPTDSPSFEDDSAGFFDDEDETGGKKAGGAQAGAPDKPKREPWAISDPLEPWNRAVFGFNDFVYKNVLDPVFLVYNTLLPSEIRQLVSNFFYNLSTPVRFVSSFMQGRFDKSFWEVSRFAVNSTAGFFGFADAASIMGMPKPSSEDFGQMFGQWGIGHGVYVVWPLLGPSSLRDTSGLLAELVVVDPVVTFVDDSAIVWTYLGYKWFHRASGIVKDYHEMTDIAIDPYSAVRNFYSQYRWRMQNQ